MVVPGLETGSMRGRRVRRGTTVSAPIVRAAYTKHGRRMEHKTMKKNTLCVNIKYAMLRGEKLGRGKNYTIVKLKVEVQRPGSGSHTHRCSREYMYTYVEVSV